jgi:hypothetical protein
MRSINPLFAAGRFRMPKTRHNTAIAQNLQPHK